MKKKRRSIGILVFLLAVAFLLAPSTDAQSLKKVRMASSSTNVSFLALYTRSAPRLFQRRRHRSGNHLHAGQLGEHGGVERRRRLQWRGHRHHRRRRPRPADESPALHRVKAAAVLDGAEKHQRLEAAQRQKNRRQFARRLGDAARQSSAQTDRPGARQGRFGSANVRQRRQPAGSIGIRRRRSIADLGAGKHHRRRKRLSTNYFFSAT